MDGSGTHEQKDMLDLEMLEAPSEQLNNAIVPTNTPPGELVQSASSVGHAGVDGRSRASTPPQRTPPSRREIISTRSP
eukprot:3486783-Prorocentrum_lima.AAC.1